MARQDLTALREQIIDTGFLTRGELGAVKYWSEAKLRDVAALFDVIAEVEQEFEDAEPADESGYDYYAESVDDYDDEFYDDLYGYEYEAVIDYGNDQ